MREAQSDFVKAIEMAGIAWLGIRLTGVPALVAPLSDSRIGVLAVIGNAEIKHSVLESLAARIHSDVGCNLGHRSGVDCNRLDEVGRSLPGIGDAAAAAHLLRGEKSCYELPDTTCVACSTPWLTIFDCRTLWNE